MDDILMSIIAIVLATILMFIFPLMTMSDRTDDISQLSVKLATTEFVDNVRTSGKITLERYGEFLGALGSTGNIYNVELEIKVLDENPGKKITNASGHTQIGENVYYSLYTSQIEGILYNDNGNNIYYLKEGDIFSVSVKNTNQTIAQQLKNFFYTVVGNDTYTIAAAQTEMVTATGR